MTTWTKAQQKAHRKLWVKALRSGKYKQTKGRLKARNGAMCCLGVACHISELGAWEPGGIYQAGGSASGLGLPPLVQDWLGLTGSGGPIGGGKHLDGENDNGVRFPALADIIEREPEGLIAK